MDAFMLTANETPLAFSDWCHLDLITENPGIRYTRVETGNVGESHRLEKAELVSDHGGSRVEQPEMFRDVLRFVRKAEPFVRGRLGMTASVILRVQLHRLSKGCFIGQHIDNEYNPDYRYSLTFHFRRQYGGGIFRVNGDREFASNDHSLISCPGHLAHEVDLVTEHQRKTLTVFLGDHPELPGAIPLAQL